MPDRYPGYDVLAKRDTLSWNDVTRRTIDRRLAIPQTPRFLTEPEWHTLEAICARILPQPAGRPPVPLAAYVDARLLDDAKDGYRLATLPPLREAWRRGLAALDQDAQTRHAQPFHTLAPGAQDTLLRAMESGALDSPAWGGMPSKAFFEHRVVPDITAAYYAHPTAWSEIGFGGPASPRGYVRLRLNRRDPWEATEAKPGQEAAARRDNRNVG